MSSDIHPPFPSPSADLLDKASKRIDISGDHEVLDSDNCITPKLTIDVEGLTEARPYPWHSKHVYELTTSSSIGSTDSSSIGSTAPPSTGPTTSSSTGPTTPPSTGSTESLSACNSELEALLLGLESKRDSGGLTTPSHMRVSYDVRCRLSSDSDSDSETYEFDSGIEDALEFWRLLAREWPKNIDSVSVDPVEDWCEYDGKAIIDSITRNQRHSSNRNQRRNNYAGKENGGKVGLRKISDARYRDARDTMERKRSAIHRQKRCEVIKRRAVKERQRDEYVEEESLLPSRSSISRPSKSVGIARRSDKTHKMYLKRQAKRNMEIRSPPSDDDEDTEEEENEMEEKVSTISDKDTVDKVEENASGEEKKPTEEKDMKQHYTSVIEIMDLYKSAQNTKEQNADGVEFYRVSSIMRVVGKRDFTRDEVANMGTYVTSYMERDYYSRKITVADAWDSRLPPYSIHHYTDVDLTNLIKAVAQGLLADKHKIRTLLW